MYGRDVNPEEKTSIILRGWERLVKFATVETEEINTGGVD